MNEVKIDRTTRLICCPNCGKRKAIIKQSFSETTNLTTITLECATENCNSIFSTNYKSGNKIAG